MSKLVNAEGKGDRWRSKSNPHLFLTNAERQLEVALQPIVDIKNGETYGYEALLRDFQLLGFESPVAVFDFAQSIGVLLQFEQLVRAKAIAKFAQIDDVGKAKLFLNVDGRVLDSESGLIAETAALLRDHGLIPYQTCLEISEIYDSGNDENVERFVMGARNAGFAIAIDDFGRGYSQLKLLYDYEPDILKIDRFFITAIQLDSRKRLFVATLVDLAHILGMRVVAEGVETAPELNVCREIGCDLVQGYYVARPSVSPDAGRVQFAHVAEMNVQRQSDMMSDVDLISRAIDDVVPLLESDLLDDVSELFQSTNELGVIPVVDNCREPKGVIRESDLKKFLYLPFGLDLLRNQSIDNGWKRFVKRCPIADVHSRLDRLIDMTSELSSEGVIITKDGQYLGFLTTTSLLKITNEVRMREAEDQNPLTKLPGNTLISKFVEECAKADDTDRYLCYIDFDHFKPFNDTYGFGLGDRAIMLFRDIVRSMVVGDDTFIGHVGGDDFFIGIKGRDPGDVVRLMDDLRAAFMHQAESFYEQKHREQGYIVAKDRSGRMRRMPLLNCSIAILHLPFFVTVQDHDLLSRTIADLKADSKLSNAGIATGCLGMTTDATVEPHLVEMDDVIWELETSAASRMSAPTGNTHRLGKRATG